MEPLSAIGLASSLIALVNFSTQLAVGARQIYHAADGALDENSKLAEVTERLKQLSEDVQNSHAHLQHDQNIRIICRSCQNVSDELIGILNNLTLLEGANHKRWKSARLVLRSMRKEDKIKQLDAHLEKLQSQLHARLSLLAHENASRQLETLRKESKGLAEQSTKKLEELKEGLIEAIREELRTQTAAHKARAEQTREERQKELSASRGIVQAMLETLWLRHSSPSTQEHNSTEEENAQSLREKHALEAVRLLPTIQNGFTAFSEESKHVARNHDILRSLCYEELSERIGDVANPHSETFQWIFTRKQLRFEEWLSSDQSTYWVSGQPGSGKSTLMKFVYSHPKTREGLRKWAGNDDIVIVQHFLWIGGNSIQTSQQGLLRSIMYQILREYPAVIPDICTERWTGEENDFEPWNLTNLSRCIHRFPSQAGNLGKICLFIDGLDEYRGNHDEIIDILSHFASSTRSKLCISSRPWNVFLKAYNHFEHKILMEEQTREDIRRYVVAKLEKNKYLNDLVSNNDSSSRYNIVKQVIDKADGVFIWVHFVVDMLLTAEQDGDTLKHIEEKINNYPSDLDQLFDRIMGTILSGKFMKDSARILMVCMAAERPQPLVIFLFLEALWVEGKDDFTLGKVPPFTNSKDMAEMFSRLRKRLRARCGDFIKITRSPQDTTFMGYKVNFFHRTVRDFMYGKDKWLQDNAGAKFDGRISLCQAILGVIKSWKYTQSFRDDASSILPFVDEMLLYAYDVEKYDGDTCKMGIILDELNRFLSQVSSQSMKSLCWTNARVVSDSLRNDGGANTFLKLTTEAGLFTYVRQQLELNRSLLKQNDVGRPLLDYALRPSGTAGTDVQRHHQPSFNMVKLLLEWGANPNEPLHLYDSQTVWTHFLLHYYKITVEPGPVKKELLKIVQALLGAGANRNVFCVLRTQGSSTSSTKYKRTIAPGKVEKLSANHILESIFEDDEEISQLI